MRKILGGLAVVGLTATAMVSGSAWADPAPPPSWCADQSNVSLLGTSADTGYGATGYPVNAQTPMRTTYGWTTRLSDNLHAQWSTATENRAHNGAMASDYLPGGRWPDTTSATHDMIATQPDLVIIDLGGNEFLTQVNPDTFGANLTTVVDNVRAARPDATVLLGAYPELKHTGTTTYAWGTYVEKIRGVAIAKGAGMIDLRRYVPASTLATQPNPSPWLTDKQHLNDSGNLVEFSAYWTWISSLIESCG